jgi:diphthine-ammonia ligase
LQQVFVSWSGGKDGCLSAYRAQDQGLKLCYLANMVTEDRMHSRTHGISAAVLHAQSEALGIPLIQHPTTWNTYEAEFKTMLSALKEKGVEGGVFGDIDLDEHREWVERVSRAVDITPHLPLWGHSQEDILKDFINKGFEAVVVATRADLLGEEWLGRKIDREFMADLAAKASNVTPCGEAGEYHTLVVDGPLFKKRLQIIESRNVLRDDHWFLEIQDVTLRDK